MMYPQTTFAGQKVSICNRYIQLFKDEHNAHSDGIIVRSLRAELNTIMPLKYHGFRLIYLSTIWNSILLDIPEVDRKIVDAKFKEALQAIRKFAKWQRNHSKPTIRRLFKERHLASNEAHQDAIHNPTLDDFSIVNGRRRMDMPSKNPHANEATNFAFAERFLHLHPDAPEDYKEAANEAIAAAKGQAQQSTFWDNSLDIEAMRLSVDMPVPPDPFEDLTIYIEVDPTDKIVVTSAKVVATGLASRSFTTLVYNDFGVNHFNGDFSHLSRMKPIAAAGGSLVVDYMLANEIGDLREIALNLGSCISSFFIDTGTKQSIRVRELDSGVGYDDDSLPVTIGNNYWQDHSRDEGVGIYGTFYDDIYNDVDYTSLFDALSLTLHTSKKDYRYLYAFASFNTGSAISFITSLESGDFDLQEVIGLMRRGLGRGLNIGLGRGF